MSHLLVLSVTAFLAGVVGLVYSLMSPLLRTRRVQWGLWGISFVIAMLWWRLPTFHGALASGVRWLAAAWLATVVLAVVLLLPLVLWALLRRLAVIMSRRPIPAHAPRTAFAYAAAMALMLAAGLGPVVACDNLRDPIVRRETVYVAGLRAGLEGLRIASIGDVHIGAFTTPHDLTRALTLAHAQRADLIAVTGDLIDDMTQLEPTLDALESSRTPLVVAVLGNHDKVAGQSAIVEAIRRRAHIRLLIDTNLVFRFRDDSLRVIGVDYVLDAQGGHAPPQAQQDAAMQRMAEKAFAGVDTAEHVVALAHHPEFFPFAAARGAMLTLASHTHGGQVRLFGRPLIQAFDYIHGRYQIGAAHLDVSAGVGHWLPLRVFVPREVVVVTLKAAR